MDSEILKIVKAKPRALINIRIFNFFLDKTCHAIYPYIYVPKRLYANLHSAAPDPYYMSIMYHEYTHIIREKEMGFIKWIFLYLINGNFRIDEELVACEAQMKYLKSKNLTFDIERSVKFLSGWTYLKAISYESVKSRLIDLWEQY